MCIYILDDNDHGDDDNDHGDDDSDSSRSSSFSKIIIGATVGSVSGVVLCIFMLYIIYKKTKKKSSAGYLRHNSPVSSQSRFLQQPYANSLSHQNTSSDEQRVPLMYETSVTPDSPAPPYTSPVNPWYSDSDQYPSEPTHNDIVILPDDVPSYPPPDYASASNYPLLSPPPMIS